MLDYSKELEEYHKMISKLNKIIDYMFSRFSSELAFFCEDDEIFFANCFSDVIRARYNENQKVQTSVVMDLVGRLTRARLYPTPDGDIMLYCRHPSDEEYFYSPRILNKVEKVRNFLKKEKDKNDKRKMESDS